MTRLIVCRRYKGVDTLLGDGGITTWGVCYGLCNECIIRFICLTTHFEETITISVEEFAKIYERRGLKQLIPPKIQA